MRREIREKLDVNAGLKPAPLKATLAPKPPIAPPEESSAPVTEFTMEIGHYKGQKLMQLPDVYLVFLVQRLEHDASLLREELKRREGRV